ncbi:MAG: glycosyl hydrolase-related protein [Bacteroidota bacterium]
MIYLKNTKYLAFLLLLLLYRIPCTDAQDTLTCDNETYSLLKALSNSQLGDGEILVFTTTHQDIAWLDEPEICIINRDKQWLTPFLERLKSDPDFKMDIEQSSIVMEYLQRHPEKKKVFEKNIKEGRICIGGTFMQPYEELYSGESLARQFYLGRKWLKDTFGYVADSYFNVDVPGRTLQMPQIAAKAGIKNIVISRHERGLFNWESPDGSKVRSYTPGHYIFFYNVLGKNDDQAIKAMAKEAKIWYEKFNKNAEKGRAVMPAMLNYEFIWDQKPVENCVPFMTKWNNIKVLKNEKGEVTDVSLPRFRFAIADEFFTRIDETTPELPEIKGERPNPWVYIHGPSHQKAIKASREGDILITQAEKFATANALVEGTFKNYPQKELTRAWEAKIYPDHGWGGKGGQVTDALFLRKFIFARDGAEAILERSLFDIAAKIKTKLEKGVPVVIFNSLNWERTDPVNFTISFDTGEARGIIVADSEGKTLPAQLTDRQFYADSSLKSASAHFIAPNVPSIGYKTFYIKTTQDKTISINANREKAFENQFFKVTFANGGLNSIFDKELNKELIDTSKFKAGEVFTMHSEGNGAGEFSQVQQPDMEGFDKTGNHETNWKLGETGSVFTSFIMRQSINHAVIEQEITFYNDIKKVDFLVGVLNWEGILYREFRMALPLNMNEGEVSYEVPFGTVTVGKDEMEGAAGERYDTPCVEIHPRGIENWISASNSDFGVTMSSSVAVADWIDPTDNPVSNQVLQPLLLASRKSCHYEGNEYLQTGDHHFEFSITSHKPGWENGAKHGRQANEVLKAVVVNNRFETASLPESLSFFKSDQEDILLTTVKKAEESNEIVIRLVELGGEEKVVHIESFKNITQANLTNLIEEEVKPLPVTKGKVQLKLGHHCIETLKIQ